MRLADGINIDARVFYDRQKIHSQLFAVPAQPVGPPARSEMILTLDQHVPTNAVGTSIQWSRAFSVSGHAQVVIAGTDFRWIDGDSDENTFALATGLTPLVHRVSG